MVKYTNKYNNILYKKYLIKSIWSVFLGAVLLYSIIVKVICFTCQLALNKSYGDLMTKTSNPQTHLFYDRNLEELNNYVKSEVEVNKLKK